MINTANMTTANTAKTIAIKFELPLTALIAGDVAAILEQQCENPL